MGVETFRNIEDQIIEKSMEGAITRFTQQWNLTDSKGSNTPMEQNLHLSPCEGADEVLDESGIQEFVSKNFSLKLAHLCIFAFTFEMMLNFRPSNPLDICKNRGGSI